MGKIRLWGICIITSKGELKKVGKEPIDLIDLHIADLLPSDPKPVRKDTSSYRINNGDIRKLTNTIVKTLRETISPHEGRTT